MLGCKALKAVTASALLAATLAGAPALAQGEADFYRGKQIRILVGSAPGGGYDLYARILADQLGRHIPGNPTLVVQNQPAAGSIVAANSVYSALPQDGTVIGAFQPGAFFEQILGSQTARFETVKFHWLGSMNQEAAAAFTWKRTSKVRTFQDFLSEESIFGLSGPNTTEQYTSLLINLFGAKIKQVAGYESVTKMYLAVERGEIEGLTTLWGSVKASTQWARNGDVNIPVQFAFAKQPDLPNVPLITQFVTPQYLRPGFTPEETLTMLKFITAPQAIAWPYAVGPGVPPERIDLLRAAMRTAVKDKDFAAAAQKINREVNFLDGLEIQRIFGEIAALPRATLDKVVAATRPKGN